MNAEYRRDPDGHYLVLGDFEHTKENTYSLNMILKNRVAGLLPVKREVLNGKIRLVYDISSEISFSDLTEKALLTEDLLRCLITDLTVCTYGFREYLLEIGKLMLHPEYIFLEQSTGRFRFCFNPYYTGNYQNDIRSLFDRILEKIDYEDPVFVKMVYEMHIAVQKDNFRISDLSDAMSRMDSSETVSVRDMFEKSPETKRKDMEGSPLDPEDDQEENPRPVSESTSKAALEDLPSGTFGKLRHYLRGKSIREVISDIDNGVFLQKMYRPSGSVKKAGSSDREDPPVRIRARTFSAQQEEKSMKKAEHEPAGDLEELLTRVPWTGEADSASDKVRPVQADEIDGLLDLDEDRLFKESVNCENEQQDRTVLLEQKRKRRLVGIGRQEGNVIEITRYPFLIGKLEGEMDCIIDRPSVSRMHARISENKQSTAGSCFIEDFNSTNGTYINGIRIEPYRKRAVNAGDVIRLADQEFVLR
ncbi:MAG: FHA domain-containing protein [Parasporobacterium sp.]|nr:FHA domain-containing protein [Parasporobacterium sp.]